MFWFNVQHFILGIWCEYWWYSNNYWCQYNTIMCFLFYIQLILFRMVWWWPVRRLLLVSRLSSRRSTGNIQGGCTLFVGSIFTLPSFSWKIAFNRDTGRYCFILRLAQFALTCYCNISNNVYSNTGTYRCQDIHNPQLFIEKTVSVLCK